MEEQKKLTVKVTELVSVLKPLVESYRLLVGAAHEFNGITPAHARDVDDAIDRADNLGDVIDDIIDTLDNIVEDWLHALEKDHKKPQKTWQTK